MAGGTIRFHREMIHRESSRASVLNHSGDRAVLHSSASAKGCLTTPSLLSRATQNILRRYACATRERIQLSELDNRFRRSVK